MPTATVVRSSLIPYFHNGRRKWYCRGTYPLRLPDGSVERRRGYVGAGHDSRSSCQQDCDRLNKSLEADASRSDGERITFARAAVAYINSGGEATYLTEPIIRALGPLDCRAVSTEIMANLAAKLYPRAKPATINRQLYTPVIAVLNLASEGKDWSPRIRRPKGHADRPPVKVPDDAWFEEMLPACGPQLRAMVLFVRIHGRRRGDALSRLPGHYDAKAHTLEIERTKNGDPILVRLSKPVWMAIEAYDWRRGPGLFGTLTTKNKRGANRMLATACKRAKVPTFGFHALGRHAWATDKAKRGWGSKRLKEGAGWKSDKSPNHYVHLEPTEVSADVARDGEKWASMVTNRGRTASPKSRKPRI